MSDWRVSRSARDGFGCVECAAAGKHGERSEEPLLVFDRRSYDQSIVARSVCWRRSASRPPLSRSSRCESRSRICAGESALSAQPRARLRAGGCRGACRARRSRPWRPSVRVRRTTRPPRSLREGGRRTRPRRRSAAVRARSRVGIGSDMREAGRKARPQRRSPARGCRAAAAARAPRCARQGRPWHRASARSTRARAPGHAAPPVRPRRRRPCIPARVSLPPREPALSCPILQAQST